MRVTISPRAAINFSGLQQLGAPQTLPKADRVPLVALTGEASQHVTFHHRSVNYLRWVD